MPGPEFDPQYQQNKKGGAEKGEGERGGGQQEERGKEETEKDQAQKASLEPLGSVVLDCLPLLIESKLVPWG